MSVAAMTVKPFPTRPATATGDVDNLGAYLSFGFAYVFGHGSSAISTGADPLIELPGWVPTTLLGAGFAVGTIFTIVAANRAQHCAGKPQILAGRLLGLSWICAFAALFLAITGLTRIADAPDLQTALWPTGSGLVVGLLYLGEGVARRNVLHYSLGTWIALTSAAALTFGIPGLFWVLAIAGGGAYAVAALFERRRLAGTAAHQAA